MIQNSIKYATVMLGECCGAFPAQQAGLSSVELTFAHRDYEMCYFDPIIQIRLHEWTSAKVRGGGIKIFGLKDSHEPYLILVTISQLSSKAHMGHYLTEVFVEIILVLRRSWFGIGLEPASQEKNIRKFSVCRPWVMANSGDAQEQGERMQGLIELT